jgi:hypothetical protein
LAGHARSATARCKNGVGHAAVTAVEHDVFNNADFFAALCFDFGANNLARLNVG